MLNLKRVRLWLAYVRARAKFHETAARYADALNDRSQWSVRSRPAWAQRLKDDRLAMLRARKDLRFARIPDRLTVKRA